MKVKKRLDVLLTEQGYADTRSKAQAIIMSGQVYVNGQKADKPGVSYEETVELEVRGAVCPYVSRGGLKLEKALRDFGVKPEGYVCSDSGASTGGFTDCLLQQGAQKVFAIDRAGLVGDDGPTHHGVFDVGFLRQMPGLLLLKPVSLAEQQDMLHWAVEEYDGPVAIRYPRGTEGSYTASDWKGLETGVSVHRYGKDLTFITYGTMLDPVMAAADILSRQGVEATVLRLMNLTDLPEIGRASCRERV